MSRTAKNLIEVRSQNLLKWLANRRLISKLERVTSEAQNAVLVPIYLFVRCTEVEEAIAAYGKADDRVCDDTLWWMEHDDSYFRDPKDKQLIKSRNYSTVTRIINEGFGSSLVSVRYNDYNSKVYKFMDDPRIIAIKAEEDEKSYKNWISKQQMAEKEMNSAEGVEHEGN